jgi:electron transfer flavoprotein alpha subunit
MGEIFVVVEHRQGEVRDITFEMLNKASDLCRKLSHTLTAVMLGSEADPLMEEIGFDTSRRTFTRRFLAGSLKNTALFSP